MSETAVGSIGGREPVGVNERGLLRSDRCRWTLDWWIGADDRWRLPATEPTVRQSLVDATPVVRTAMRVPGGDAVQHVYGAGPDVIAIDVANDSPAPFVLALVVRGAHRLAVDGPTVSVDDAALTLPRVPARWAVTTDGTTHAVVADGAATAGPFPARQDRAGRLDAAFLLPVAHRTGRRAALRLDRGRVEVGRLPAPAAAARGWQAQLDRGMRVDLPDRRLADGVQAARAAVLLAATRPPVAPAVVAALEDWGFDAEARAAWSALGWRARRQAGRRRAGPPDWATVEAARADGPPGDLLLSVRGLLAHEGDDGTVTLLPELPPGWRGAPVEVHDVPTRRGVLSYAVRWHGDRPALLWAAPAGVRLRAPGLDPDWVTAASSGDALLAARAA